jgi:hypothetical protein
MPDSSLHTRLAAIRQAAAAHRRDLAQDLADCQAVRARLQSEIARLQEQLAAADAAWAHLDEQLANPRQIPADEATAVIAVFSETYGQLAPLVNYLRDRQAIQAQRAALLAEDPALPDLLNDYRTVEADLEASLRALPPTYRADMLDRHKERGGRLAPYFALEQAEAALPSPPALRLPIVIVQDPAGPHIVWLLPIPVASLGADSVLDTLVSGLVVAFRGLGDQPGWCVLDDITRDQWAGYTALRALAEYTGPAPVAAAVQKALANTLPTLPTFDKIMVTVEVAEMSREAWQPDATPLSTPISAPALPLAAATPPRVVPPMRELETTQVLDQPPAPPPPAVAPATTPAALVRRQPQLEQQTARSDETPQAPPAPALPPAASQTLGKLSSGWYNDADIVDWERSSKAAEPRAVTVQKRRLRTLLTRLIAQGKVGGAIAPHELLWSSLPEPHCEEMRVGIDLLIAKEILLPANSHPNDGPGITVNPGMLGLVQDLLTQDTAALWSTLLGEPGNITELRSATAPASRLPPLRPRRTG